MNRQTIALRVAATVFALMTVAQALRLVFRPEIAVAGHLLPLWPSAIACPALALLALWLWNVSRNSHPR